ARLEPSCLWREPGGEFVTASWSCAQRPGRTQGIAMRLSFRLICSLVVVLTLVSLLFSYAKVRIDKDRLRQELRNRAQTQAESLQEGVEPALEKGSRRELQRIVERFGDRGHLEGIAIYDRTGKLVTLTSGLTERFPGLNFLPTVPVEI